tara:strand:+ start:1783 stop:2970 length:1188 start_codon:yes stop_codon:yes gene_type:complete
MKRKPPLDGIVILSFEHAIAAPLCTRQLAELGARVIKIERRETGDFARSYDTRTKGQSSHFIWTNRSKESLTLDIKNRQSSEILDRLLSKTDVLVQNLAPSAMKKLGLDYNSLKTQHEKLIVCNISGYGSEGPFKDRKAYDLLVQAESGFLSITGTDKDLVKSGISIADIAAGMHAFSAILAAIIERGKSGKGSCIDISMLEAMVEWMGFPLLYSYDGATPPKRTGSDHASIYPYGVFETGDAETLMIGLQNEREWAKFCDIVLKMPQLIDDRRFSANTDRSMNREALRGLIQSVFNQQSTEELIDKLKSAGIAYANVNDMDKVWSHEQLEKLNRFIITDTPEGKVSTFLPPTNNSEFDPAISPVPKLGQHSKQILGELGFSNNEIKAFQENKVI